MIVLNGTTETLQSVLSAAPATTQPIAVACYADTPGAGVVGDSAIAFNGVTAITIVPAPLATFQRVIRSVSIFNGDSASVTITLNKVVSATTYPLAKITLAAGYTLMYTQDGWKVTDTSGASVASGGGGGMSNPMTTAGDLIVGGTSGAPARLGIGSTGQVPTVVAGAIAWQTPTTGGASTSLAGINDQTGTAYTLVLTDAGKDVRINNAAAITLTVPSNAAVAFPIGTMIPFSQKGAGVVTATTDGTSVIRAPNGAATTAQYDARVLEKTDSDTWRVW